MGLAASQARFLGLTARKSNVEYKGQQINQQRTALSNEILGLYNKYSALDVPVPPSINDFENTVYSLDATSEGYEISSFSKINDGEYAGYYDVQLTCPTETPKAYSYMAKDSVITTQKNNDSYSYLSIKIGLDEYIYEEDAEGNAKDGSNITKITGDYENHSGLTTIMNAQGLTDGTFYAFTDKNGTTYYTSENSLNQTVFETVEGKDTYYGNYTFDYQGVFNSSKTISAKAALTQDKSGRLTTIQIMDCEENNALEGSTYSITTTSRENEAEYQDAMNKYHYEKAIYERKIEEINKKTETLQKEDRSLELQLNQLDTEQKAISTEMESISKVLEETMKAVFKTFSS